MTKHMILREMVVTYKGTKVEVPEGGKRIDSSATIDKLFRSMMDQPTERFVAVMLDAKNRVMGYSVIAMGGTTSCAVTPVDVFRAAVMSGAVGLVVMHNHPSGDPHPSQDDIVFTGRLVQCASLLGVRIIDHVIIAREGYYSFLDSGLLQELR